MENKRVPMRLLDLTLRSTTFSEVALGYSEEEALAEASRCLSCKNMPCVSGCPVGINIPEFIKEIKNKDYEKAYIVISKYSSLPAICGRVCPQESQCESKCIRGIKSEPVAIGRLERFVSEHRVGSNIKISPDAKKVAVVGSGPAGLACAAELTQRGYKVTIFEALHKAGGVLVYGIPEFRLPKSVVADEISNLEEMGVEIITNAVIGKTVTIDELFNDGYEAVFVGSGAGLPNFMGIEGESLKGVYSANEFLTRSNLMKAYDPTSDTPIMKATSVAVVGGGNVAMDCARTAKRLGAEHVYLVYRRSMEELPARKEEVEHALEEGIEPMLLSNPVKINGYRNENDRRDPKNGFVSSITCIKMELGEPDEKGRRSPKPIENSEFTLDVDCVIMAIGTSPNPLIPSSSKDIEVNRRGCLVVNESQMTSKDGVFAGGDAVTGAATVILAMGAGKSAAAHIDEYIRNKQ